jgi:antitoxin component HigA of HigAB toxin-antitoxin module
LKQIDLAPLFGGRSRIFDVLAGKRQISTAQAKAISVFFKVPADLFI